MPLLADELGNLGIVEVDFQLVRPVLARYAREEQQLSGSAVVHALKFLARADRPVAGVGLNAELVLELIEQVERVARLAVHFVDERKNRNVAHRADLEEFSRLGLHAFRAVNHHDCRVRGHERAVRVLREVLVSRGIQNIDAVALILELHDGGRDRNAALLFDLHPVGDRRTRILLALDRARLRNRPAVEQELFSQRRFTGVGVRDDRKRSAPGDFFFQGSHVFSSKF